MYSEYNKRHIDIEYSIDEGLYGSRKCCFSGDTYEEALNEVLSYINECDYLSGIRYPHKNEVLHKIKTSLGDADYKAIEITEFEECPATMVNDNMQYTFKTVMDIHFNTHIKGIGDKLNNILGALSNLGFVVRFDECRLECEDLTDVETAHYIASFSVEGVLPCS